MKSMTEKAIHNHLNRCYYNCYAYEQHDDEYQDEWYGEDSALIWHWYRPREDKDYKLVLDPDTKEIKVYVCEHSAKYKFGGISDDAFKLVDTLREKDYFYPTDEEKKNGEH